MSAEVLVCLALVVAFGLFGFALIIWAYVSTERKIREIKRRGAELRKRAKLAESFSELEQIRRECDEWLDR